MKTQQTVRELLLEQLEGKHAHVDFDRAVRGLTLNDAGSKVNNLPHTIWQLIEHIRISTEDIVDFSQNPDYEEIDWPTDYWPSSPQPGSEEVLKASIERVKSSIEEMRKLVRNPDNNLLQPIPHGSGQTLFREAMLIVDHNAYHIGQIVQLRRMLGGWG